MRSGAASTTASNGNDEVEVRDLDLSFGPFAMEQFDDLARREVCTFRELLEHAAAYYVGTLAMAGMRHRVIGQLDDDQSQASR